MINFLIRAIASLTFHGLFFLGALFITLSVLGPKSFYRKADLPKYGQFSPKDAQHDPIVQLADETGDPFCTAFVIDSNYALTAAHCVEPNTSYTIIIPSEKTTDHSGFVAVGINNRVDVALIMGDFSNYKNMRVDFYGFTPANGPGKYATCGYPYLQRKLTCNNFVPRVINGFTLGGWGFLIPGMSGGPVLDMLHGHVIGINSSMGTSANIAPVLGALGAFGIEP